MSIQNDTLAFLSKYGSTILLYTCLLTAAILLRKLLRLPPRADLYVFLYALLCSNLGRLEPYTQWFIQRINGTIHPRYNKIYYPGEF